MTVSLRLILPAVLVALAVLVPPASAGTPMQYFERTVAQDKADDYSTPGHNGALDILGVHLAERYTYDSENSSGQEIVQFRIELRQRDAIKQLPPDQAEGTTVTLQAVEYTLGFTAGGKATQITVPLTQVCVVSPPPGGGGFECNTNEPSVPKPHFTTKEGGIVVVLEREKAGLPVGTAITKVWAASALVSQGQKTYHDVAPKDNANQPEGSALAAPATPATTYTLDGTFPFITMALDGSAQAYALPGGTASFVLKFRTHDNLNGIDHVYIDFQAPPGWTFEGNLGTDFITTGGGQDIEYEFLAKAPAFAASGDEAAIRVDASLQSAGGHQSTLVNVQVSGAKVEASDYVFDLATPGPFKAETPAKLTWNVQRHGLPLENFAVAADFLLNGKVVDEGLPATAKEPGVYEVDYTFPSGGLWTVDVYVSELQPSPHAASAVTVQSADGGLLPGFGLLGAWGALGVALWRRRL